MFQKVRRIVRNLFYESENAHITCDNTNGIQNSLLEPNYDSKGRRIKETIDSNNNNNEMHTCTRKKKQQQKKKVNI